MPATAASVMKFMMTQNESGDLLEIVEAEIADPKLLPPGFLNPGTTKKLHLAVDGRLVRPVGHDGRKYLLLMTNEVFTVIE